MSHVRKAIGAGVLAALTLIGTKVQTTGLPATGPDWVAMLLSAAGAGVMAGLAVYGLRNEGTVNGSDPR